MGDHAHVVLPRNFEGGSGYAEATHSEYLVRCPRKDIRSDRRRRTVTRKADPNEKWLLIQSSLEDFWSSFVSALFDRLSAAASLAKMSAFSSQTSQPSIRARCRQNASND
jgi:hypothetical protein